jgi:hypothetical protein
MTTALRQTTALRKRMHQDLQLAGLSKRTQEAYLRAVRQLADHFHTPPDRLSEQQVREYLLHLKNDRNFGVRPPNHVRPPATRLAGQITSETPRLATGRSMPLASGPGDAPVTDARSGYKLGHNVPYR